MGVDHEHRRTILGVPEGDATIFVSRDYFSSMISPEDNPLLRLSLGISDPLGTLLLAWVSDVENSDVAINV